MKVLVSGAGGFLGRHVVQRLLDRGHQVRAMLRPAADIPSWNGEVEIFRADLRSHGDLKSAFDGQDAIIHLAAPVRGDEDTQFASAVIGTERLLTAMSQTKTKRIVHVSSLVVYDWARIHAVMDEQSPTVSDIYGRGGYTIAKVWQERVVFRFAARHQWDLTVARPGFVWGREHADVGGMGRRFGGVYVMFGPFTRHPLTHVENCAACLVTALGNPSAVGKVFNIVDDDRIRVWRYASEHRKRSGGRGFMLPIPYYAGLAAASLASFVGRKFFGSRAKLPSLLVPRQYEAQFKPLRYSTRRLKTDLGWQPSLTFEQCLNATYK